MKLVIVAVCAALIPATGQGGPTERAVLAAMKLSEQPNYSWTSVIVDDARTYQIEGQTMRGNCTWIRQPMVVSLARRLGPRAALEVEAIFRGNERCVVHTLCGWQALSELPREHRDWTEADEWRYLQPDDSARWSLAGSSMASTDPNDPFTRTLRATPEDDEDAIPRSNAQFGVSHPHEELGIIVSCHTALEADGETIVGKISDLGAQLLLVRDGQDDIKPLAATGTFRLQIKDGIVVAYALRLEGVLEIGRRRQHVHQYSQTTLQRIGTTHFDPPEEARQKLGLD